MYVVEGATREFLPGFLQFLVSEATISDKRKNLIPLAKINDFQITLSFTFTHYRQVFVRG